MEQETQGASREPVAVLQPFDEPERRFFSFDELRAFFAAEREAWGATRHLLTDYGRRDWGKPIGAMFQLFDKVDSLAQQAHTDRRDAEILNALNSSRRKLVLADSAAGRTIIALAANDVDVAATLLAAIAGSADITADIKIGGSAANLPLVPAVRGFVHRELVLAGVPDAHHLATNMGKLAHEARSDINAAKEMVSAWQNRIAEADSERRKKFAEWESDHKKRLTDIEAEARAKVQETEAIYAEKIKLHATVTYWTEIASKAQSAGWWHFSFFVLIAAGALIGALFGMKMIFSMQSLGAIKDLGLVGTALISLPVILVLWVLKHLARGHVDAKRTAADARHRATLVETYLALIKEGLASDPSAPADMQEKVRILMLGAIFNHPGPGNETDSLPATLIEAVTKNK